MTSLRKFGASIAGFALVLAAIDRLTGGVLSSTVARAICGSTHMVPLGGVVGDMSCGFNADLHFMAAMAAAAVVGAVVVALAGRRL